jgi:hypothetical protein
MRKVGLEFAAGFALSDASSLFRVLLNCAMRQQLPEDLRVRIGNRSDYFLPPGWDSRQKVDAIELFIRREEVIEENTVSEIMVVPNWETFYQTNFKSRSNQALLAKRRQSTPGRPRNS